MHGILKKREKIILYITIGIIFFSITFNFIIAPVLGRYDTLLGEINLSKIRLKKYLTLLARKNEIQNKYSRFSENSGPATDTKDNLVVVMAALENIAKSAGVRIIDIRPQPQSRGDAVVVELRTEGSMDEYTKFIYDAETSLFLLKINRLQFTAKPNMAALEAMFTISQPVISK